MRNVVTGSNTRFMLEALEVRLFLSTTTPLRIVTYNILADIPSQGITASPQPAMETVLEGIGSESVGGSARPIDILALQETQSNVQSVAPMVAALNAHYGANTYAYSTFQASSSGNLDGNGPNAMIYNTTTVQLVSSVGLYADTVPRQPVRYEFRPVGGSRADEFYVYDDHYKSGDEFTDNNGQRREAEAEAVRADEATLPANSRVIYAGDYNVFYPSDAGYVAITAGGTGQAVDPINSPNFHGSTAPINTLTDSTSSLASRLDFQLLTENVISDTGGLHYTSGTYHAFGNDGSTRHVNTSTSALPGLPNRSAVLSALVTASDHLPLVADYTDTVTAPVGPNIGAFSVSPTSVNAGSSATLTASNIVEHGTGSVSGVAFYRESNGLPGLQIGSDTGIGNVSSTGGTTSLSTSTSGLGGGNYTYYAVATDSASISSDSATTVLTVVGPQTPTIGGFSANPTSVVAGGDVTLTASGVAKSGGTIANVKFYLESNGTQSLQIGSDALVGGGTQGGSTWTGSVSTTGLSAGSHIYYAVATDTSGVSSAVSSTTVTVAAPPAPTIGSFTVSPSSITVGDPFTLTAANVVQTSGHTVADVSFYEESNSIGGLQQESDTDLGSGSQSGSTWTLNVPGGGLAAGNYTIYAVATDDADTSSPASTATLAVSAPPVPLVKYEILASASAGGPYTSNLAVSSGETVYFEVQGSIADLRTANGSKTVNSLSLGTDGIVATSFNLINAGASNLPITFTGSTVVAGGQGVGYSGGSAGPNALTAVKVAANTPSGYSPFGVTATDTPGYQLLLSGTFVIGGGATGQTTIGETWGGVAGSFKINGGAATFVNSAANDATYNAYAPLNLSVASLPAWLDPTSSATFNASTHALTITGAAKIIADPGTDAPVITANGAVAQLKIQPTVNDIDVHVGGITLTGGAGVDVVSVGGTRSHSNHNVLVIKSGGAFSVDSTSKLNLEDNDLIVHNGSIASVRALAATGRHGTPDGVLDGAWDGNGLTSSSAKTVDANVGYEQNALGVVLNGELPLGSYASWKVGSATEALTDSDVIVKYTYVGDNTLSGAVDSNAATVFLTNYNSGSGFHWSDGDTNLDGKIDSNDATAFLTLFGNGTGGIHGAAL